MVWPLKLLDELERRGKEGPLLKRFVLWILGYAPLCRVTLRIPDERTVRETIYVVRCPRCCYVFLDYPRDHDGRFTCPRCGQRS